MREAIPQGTGARLGRVRSLKQHLPTSLLQPWKQPLHDSCWTWGWMLVLSGNSGSLLLILSSEQLMRVIVSSLPYIVTS